ncbi:hypothetical protein GN956_G19237 [Arapaima gigas]
MAVNRAKSYRGSEMSKFLFRLTEPDHRGAPGGTAKLTLSVTLIHLLWSFLVQSSGANTGQTAHNNKQGLFSPDSAPQGSPREELLGPRWGPAPER